MFTYDNFSNAGIEYDYDELNKLLADILPDYGEHEDAEKNASGSINDDMRERDGVIVSFGRVVGRVVSA